MAVFIVLWPYLLTTKLKSVVCHNLGYSNPVLMIDGTMLKNCRTMILHGSVGQTFFPHFFYKCGTNKFFLCFSRCSFEGRSSWGWIAVAHCRKNNTGSFLTQERPSIIFSLDVICAAFFQLLAGIMDTILKFLSYLKAVCMLTYYSLVSSITILYCVV